MPLSSPQDIEKSFSADRELVTKAILEEVKAIEQADIASTKQNGEKTIPQIIEQGEGHTLEFKETLEYDVQTKQKNSDVLFSSLKTIVGFLNADGGTLLIGVNDSGEIKGIERDLSTMKHGSNDRFEQKIRSCMRDRFSPQPIGKVKISFEKFTEGTICRVDVPANKDIIHLDGDIYVRDGNTTLKLEGRDRTDWIQRRGE
jgi:predicted HTH transcriptional regulator